MRKVKPGAIILFFIVGMIGMALSLIVPGFIWVGRAGLGCSFGLMMGLMMGR